MMSSLTRDRNWLPSIFCSVKASARVPHSLIPRKVATSSTVQLEGSKSRPLADPPPPAPLPEPPPDTAEGTTAACPAESTRRGTTLTGEVSDVALLGEVVAAAGTAEA